MHHNSSDNKSHTVLSSSTNMSAMSSNLNEYLNDTVRSIFKTTAEKVNIKIKTIKKHCEFMLKTVINALKAETVIFEVRLKQNPFHIM